MRMTIAITMASDGNDELCEKLLADNADPNFKDNLGLTPLYFACNDGNNSLAEKLINKGADVNAAGCLQIALDLYYNDVAQTLIEHGCDVNKVKTFVIQEILQMKLLYIDVQEKKCSDECCQDWITRRSRNVVER